MKKSKDPEKRFLLNNGANSSGPSSLETSDTQPQAYNATEKVENFQDGFEPTPKSEFFPLGLTRRTSEAGDGITLSWKNISVQAPLGQKTGCLSCLEKQEQKGPAYKQILKNVTGVAKAGSFLVVMGASGSGKTTLLNVLTQRNLGVLETQGTILANGRPMGEEINAVSGYIQQDDLFVESLTVMEHLWFNAVLRMNKDLSIEQRKERIEEVLQEMGLKRCEDTVIGVPGMVKGLSGGEKKRLAFASELLTRPSIMFCDEPTSGLDSFMAQSVIESLKKLTSRGRTIVCTIHQPSSEVFAMFDEILMMAEGRVAFMGPTSEMPKFFSDLGYNCPPNYNPADFYIQTLAIVPGKEIECKDKVSKISDMYTESRYARTMQYVIEEQEEMVARDKFVVDMDTAGSINGPSVDVNKSDMQLATRSSDRKSTSKYEASWMKQLHMCLWRSGLDVRRNKRVLPARVLQVTVAGIFLGALYWQQDYDMTGVSNINGALFMLMIQVSFNVSFTIATAFAREFPVFLKENQDRQYCVSAYYLGKVLIDLPVIAFAATMYTSCSYWMIGLYPSVQAFFVAWAALLLISQVAVAYGHLASAIFPNPQLALTLLPFMLGLTLLFSGFLIKENSIIKIFKPIAWVSAYKYTYEILIVNQWRDVTRLDASECDFSDQAQSIRDTMNVTANYASNETAAASNWCYPSGLAVIYSYQYEPGHLTICFAINTAIFFCVELLGYLFLRLKAMKKL